MIRTFFGANALDTWGAFLAAVIIGALFGVGFVMGGWCPGTAAVGAASGKLDALIFLGGAVLGSIFFNEFFPVILPLYHWGDQGVTFIYQTLNLSLGSFALIFTSIAVACFWGVEFLERSKGRVAAAAPGKVLPVFSVAVVLLALGLTSLPGAQAPPGGRIFLEAELIVQVESGQDHLEPEELADRLVRGEPDLLAVDIRPPVEYQAFHIRGAVNITMGKLSQELEPRKNKGTIVLYSNGMTHPAQARDSLHRQGFGNVYLLTDGLQSFMERCLKPVSLRSEPPAASSRGPGQGLAGVFYPQGGSTPPRRRPCQAHARLAAGAGGARPPF
jgi:thiosulfate/3-mercaptopyruvate sulfurtransferase